MEEWRSINGFDHYIVSNMGNVKNVITGNIIGKKTSNKYQYKRIKLSQDGKKLFIDVHRLVAETFIPNPEKLEVVNHINGDKSDNRVENLEWCTRSYNQLHAYKTGLQKVRTGEQVGSSKLTKENVQYIKSHYKKYDKEFNAYALARKFGVTNSTIFKCLKGENWKEVTT